MHLKESIANESIAELAEVASEKHFIVIEGPIGVGKTSLARRLAASFGSGLMLEDAKSNPFLKRFYQKNQAAFPTQLFFLFQRVQQLEDMRQSDLFNPLIISDYLIDKDRMFAELILDADELSLYHEIFDKQDIKAPTPDLVVYLQAPVSTLRSRLLMRGNHYESRISNEYLTTLAEAYSRFFHDYNKSPLLIVNTEDIDPVHNDEDLALLKQRIDEIESGRHYFNPVSFTV